jgi:thiol-disulfide isomerase/thioredoxin
VGLQAWTKPEPDQREIDSHAENMVTPRLWHGRVAPEFELPLLDGATFKLSDHIGKRAVIVNFFATWCAPCRAEMPELERYARALAGEPVLLVGVDAEEQRAVVERFIKQVKTTFPIALDQEGDVIKAYRVSAFPTTVVIGADGRVKLYESGAILNADVSLAGTIAPELEALRAGRGITLDGYRAALQVQPPLPRGREDEDDGALTGRALAIARKMGCPCGCDDTVHACGCQTADKIKARLAKGDFGDKTDAELMTELNAEFCMKGM